VTEQFPPGLRIVPRDAREAVLQLHAEEAVVGTRLTRGETVRVATVTHAHDHVVDVPLTREVIEVERVPIGQVVEVAPAIRYEGDVTILPVLEEVELVVIERRLMLKEEIHVRRRRLEETHRETISLRSQSAVVTRFVAGHADPTLPSTTSD
jgi:stress response protein YsnF